MNGVIGEVRLFAGNFAPRTWAFCQGQLLAISSNTALFSILGTTYGGDGRTTFKLPDYRGRNPLGTGNGPGLGDMALGAQGGIEEYQLNALTMASHTHIVNASQLTGSVSWRNANGSGDIDEPGNNNWAQAENDAGDDFASSAEATSLMGPAAVIMGGSVTLGNTGNGSSIDNIEPRMGLNYIVCMQGVYPSRS